MKKINIKNIVRIIASISILLFFVPSFLVSCEGQNIYLSTSDMTFGKSMMIYGTKQQIVTKHIGTLAFLLLPLVLLLLWTVVRLSNYKVKYIISVGIAVVDIILWMVLKGIVKEEAEKNMFVFASIFGYELSIFLMFLIIVMMVLLYLGILNENDNFSRITTGKEVNSWTCKSCGNKLPMSSSFCTKCGASKEEPNINNSNQTQNEVCATCGTPWKVNDKFCTKCGTQRL